MKSASPSEMDAFRPHDHGRCRRAARAAVEAECKARALRLTPARALVLDALLESHKAMTAYELLERLRAAGLGKQPPIAYRALEFLVDQGLAHRIQRLNAFTACAHPGEAHAPAFLICRSCSAVAEAEAGQVRAALDAAATAIGFVVERSTIEALGLCPACHRAAA